VVHATQEEEEEVIITVSQIFTAKTSVIQG